VRALRSFGEQIDIVRLADDEQIAVPRWMLDPIYCAQLPQEPKPRVAITALLRLADWIARQDLLRHQPAPHSEDCTITMKGDQAEHVLRTNPSSLSIPAGISQSDAVGQTPRTHPCASASASEPDVTAGPDESRQGKEQP
jgi:hypothetical protein